MELRVRTAFGDSEETYGGDLFAIPFDHPPQGAGQGNGASPAIWAVVSTPVLYMLHAAGHGVSFRLAISKQTFNLVGFAFVDDSDVIQQAPSHDSSAKEIMAAAQEGLDRFVGGMRVTGGDVRPDKSWTYLIEFQ